MSVKKWKFAYHAKNKNLHIKIDKQINFNFTYINPALRLETLPFIFSLDHPFLSSSPLSLLSAHMCYNIFISYQKLFLTSSFWQSQRVVVRHRVSWKLFFTSWSEWNVVTILYFSNISIVQQILTDSTITH